MIKQTTTITGSIISKEQINQTSSCISEDTVAHRRCNISMVEDVLVIWLDRNIDEEHDDDCRNTITQLRRVVNSIETFAKCDPCIDFLTDIDTVKVLMIISDELGPHIVSLIHDVTQLDSIYVFSGNKTYHEQWVKEWPKIKGVFFGINPICEALIQTMQECQHNAISIKFMPTHATDASNKNLNHLDCSFMYTQILKEILLTIEFDEQHTKEFTDHCCELFVDNDAQLNNVKDLEKKYHEKTPIWWYTYECFLYPLINRALRIMDMNIIIMMGFFIGDLHRHIQQLHSEQLEDHRSSQIFTVYRGQGLSKTDFDQMRKTKGGLMSFNNFLSTSRNRDVSFLFAESNQSNPDLVGILFIVSIDPTISSTPFASINDVSYFKKQEEEVLFSMHTVFRIHEIQQMDGNDRLWEVELTLTSENDPELHGLTESMREEIEGSSGWFRLGRLLIAVGQPDQAQKVFERMLEQSPNQSDKANIFHQLGSTNFFEGNYGTALSFFKNSLDIRQKSLDPNHPDLANSYNGIGAVYYKIGEYSEALSLYEKALELQKKILPSYHPDLAKSYNNIGLVYNKMGEYPKALSYFEKDLEISKRSLPPDHPGLAITYMNVGNVYDSMDEYSKALSSNEKALEIRLKSLPPNHPDLAASYNNIGSAYCSMGEYSKALLSHEKSLEIKQISLRPHHSDLASSYINIGTVYNKIGEYSKALSSYEKALEIKQKSLSSNHPDLANLYVNIGDAYRFMGEYSKALSSHEKAFQIRLQSLPSDHPDLCNSYINIGIVYQLMSEYSKAVSYYEKSLEIQQKSLPSNHPDLATSYANIGILYYMMGEYSKAISSHEKALEIQQKYLSPGHRDLAKSFWNIGTVHNSMGEYSKALSYYEKTLEIQQKSLPSNHPDLTTSYANIGFVCYFMGEYSKAVSYHEKALEIQQKSLPSDHLDLASSCNIIGIVFDIMGEYSKACSFYERAVSIGQTSLPENHSDVQKFRKNLDLVKKKF